MSEISESQIHDALMFLFVKIMDTDGEYCPLSGFCANCDPCFIEKFMDEHPRNCTECGKSL